MHREYWGGYTCDPPSQGPARRVMTEPARLLLAGAQVRSVRWGVYVRVHTFLHPTLALLLNRVCQPVKGEGSF